MKKNVYAAPVVEFVAIEAEKDVLAASFEDVKDAHQNNYGIDFWY